MVDVLIHLVTVFEFLCFLASLTIYLKKNPPLFLKPFPIFLLITVVIEVIATVLRVNKMPIKPLYNFFSVFEIEFYLFVFYCSIKNKPIKQVIFYSGILYPTLALINIFQTIKKFHSSPIAWVLY
jgi:hypothetical protein